MIEMCKQIVFEMQSTITLSHRNRLLHIQQISFAVIFLCGAWETPHDTTQEMVRLKKRQVRKKNNA